MSGEQDIFKMGGLHKKLPRTFWTFLIAAMAIAGLPGLSGFFSKDLILWKAFSTENTVVSWWRFFVWGCGVVAALGTAFYMFRLVYLTFAGECRASEEVKHHIHESPWTMTVPLIILAFLSITGGFLGLPEIGGLHNVLHEWFKPVFGASESAMTERHFFHGAEEVQSLFMILVAAAGILIARSIYRGGNLSRGEALAQRHPAAHRVLLNKYYVDEIYNATAVRPFMSLTRILSWIDSRIVDGLVNLAGYITKMFAMFDGAVDRHVVDGAVNLVAGSVISAGRRAKTIQTGRLQDYLYIMAAGAALIVVVSRIAQ
jgi:NADH-quinone oxidoreductase subunit L